jgi:hypothetical protein
MTSSDPRVEYALNPSDVPHRTPAELTALARGVILGQTLVTNEPELMKLSFGFVLSGVGPINPDCCIGGLIGHMEDSTGVSINGAPIFLSVAFLHLDDLPFVLDELTRMRTALGLVEGGK